MRTLEVWYERMDIDAIERYRSQMSSTRRQSATRSNEPKAESKNSIRAFAKLTQSDGGELRIVSDPPLIIPIAQMFEGVDAKAIEKRLREVYSAYVRTLDRDVRQLVERYRFVDIAHKVVGVGSVGTRAWILLLLGRDSQDPLFLQAKEAQGSVLEPFTGAGPVQAAGEARRGGAAPDAGGQRHLPGLASAKGVDGKERDFYVRQLWDGKGSAEIERMNPTTMGALREALRVDARAGPRALGRPHCDRRLPRQGRGLRPGHRRIRRGLRGSERPATSRSSQRRSSRSSSTRSPAFDLGHTPLQEAPLGVRVHELQRPLVGRQGLALPVQSPQQFRASGVEVVVALELEAVGQRQRLPPGRRPRRWRPPCSAPPRVSRSIGRARRRGRRSAASPPPPRCAGSRSPPAGHRGHVHRGPSPDRARSGPGRSPRHPRAIDPGRPAGQALPPRTAPRSARRSPASAPAARTPPAHPASARPARGRCESPPRRGRLARRSPR